MHLLVTTDTSMTIHASLSPLRRGKDLKGEREGSENRHRDAGSGYEQTDSFRPGVRKGGREGE